MKGQSWTPSLFRILIFGSLSIVSITFDFFFFKIKVFTLVTKFLVSLHIFIQGKSPPSLSC